MTPLVRATLAALLLIAGTASAADQQLETRFSCSVARTVDGEKVIYADNGEISLAGSHIDAFRWESSLFRSTHGFDCSIDESDGLVAEVRDAAPMVQWRIALKDANDARTRRGYDFDRLPRCTIRLEREGDTLNVKPSCPALCGSRPNFSELSVNLKTGQCRYEE
ncbi:hypothetical protein [Noviherbaspirillum denitrificans]|uniref:Uncharacterized protein n=1 Tax=Noviherbaspirillum denitrificans TaxID=1968433 RepID=A0A254TCI6_9BURK|nr:hypothetical protein [Noviherbaspirillum denitrificans]OWW20366.1 hypothetical protein AYR66_13585 [Noviherbaspirillum denitrificans]